MTATTQVNAISLKGSTKTVTEYFAFAINQILYLRQVYPSNCFTTRPAYDLQLPVAQDEKLNAYLTQVLNITAQWLMTGQVKKIVLAILAGEKAIECWEFNVDSDTATNSDAKREIQAVMRQITASVSFLPVISEKVIFDIQVHADENALPPQGWETTKEALIQGQSVDFRKFQTGVHSVGTRVVYEERGGDI
ncbi:Mitotic spindle checkpoint protein MAD2 [Spironucleus salmonicida]|uniref:Mitotic spindle checkpoint protein MAD2 n=1 Tax=Spironucleus salmonicida TaxID=348837 RepID=V6LZ67_9EUKA|nr:Mitotic spindle checkpoint protein MAD2 [Spironucleus salmonicida]|eukprot:EST46129.1 Mitotic spindle checkpoint protein MAD2 [Spironucleus salmonicida]